MPKLSDTVEIFKTLPSGRRVTRTVTGEEFINGGWAQQGWAANASLQKAYEDKVYNDTWDDLNTRPIDYLQTANSKLTIAKKLPNGKWVSRQVNGIDFEHKGWRSQGWIIPSFMYNRRAGKVKDTSFARTRLINSIMTRSDFWRPKRSTDQARTIASPSWKLVGPELGHNYNQDVANIRDYRYIPNPKWHEWIGKAQRWMLKNRPKVYKRAMKESPVTRRINLRPLFMQYNRKHKAPPKFIPPEEEEVLFHDAYRSRNFGPQ